MPDDAEAPDALPGSTPAAGWAWVIYDPPYYHHSPPQVKRYLIDKRTPAAVKVWDYGRSTLRRASHDTTIVFSEADAKLILEARLKLKLENLEKWLAKIKLAMEEGVDCEDVPHEKPPKVDLKGKL